MEQNETTKFVGRIVAGAYYDMQQVRIATKHRIRDVIRKKIEGIPFDAVEEKKEMEQKSLGKEYTDKKLITMWNDLLKENDISDYEHKYVLRCWDVAEESEKIEAKYKKAMMEFVEEEAVYKAFLGAPIHRPSGMVQEGIRGIGPVISANLIKEFGNCNQYDNVSKLWAHTGNDVRNGVAPKKKKGETLGFNPRLRTLTWKISDCLMKQNKGYYRELYDKAKKSYLKKTHKKGKLKKQHGKPYKEKDTKLSKGHAHNRALRIMRKHFLFHYWEAARTTAGIPTKSPWINGKEKHSHIIHYKDVLNMEGKLTKRKEQAIR